MPTPHFMFRLPAEDAKKLRELASLFYGGAPNMASKFARELVQTITSGDHAKVVTFLTTLQSKMLGQLTLLSMPDFKLKAVVQDGPPKGAEKPPLKAKRKGGRHVRSTR